MSSTLGELANERQAARRAIEQLRLAPVMFELGARPHPPRSDLRMAELEAATRLATLHAGTPREEDSVSAVRELLDAFTEGFSTPQLVAASAVARRLPIEG